MFAPELDRVRVAEAGDLAAVREIHKSRKRWLGHLPDQPFEDALNVGCILVAECDGDIGAYLLYRHRTLTNDVAVVHLATASDYERRGLGAELVEFLLDRVSDRRRVVLRCRKDYPAHQFWMDVGFEAVSESPGNSADRALLTSFERRLHHEPSLFDGLFELSQSFGVDLDVLLDLATDRDQGVLTREVFHQLDQFRVHPMRTTSLMNELSNHGDASARETARQITSGWEQAGQQADAAALGNLSARVPGLGNGDLRHLADAEANTLSILLTRDVKFERAVSLAAPASTTVTVTQPAAFVDQLMRGDGLDYRPLAVAGLSTVAASDHGIVVLADEFVCQELGERKAALRDQLRVLFAADGATVLCLERDNAPIALFSVHDEESLVEIELLRVGRGMDAASIARHVIAQLRRTATSRSGLGILRVADSKISASVERALTAEGFSNVEGSWLAVAMEPQQVVSDVHVLLESMTIDGQLAELRSRLIPLVKASRTDASSVALLEKTLDPLVVVESCLPAVVVPIRAQWSDRLLGVSSSQLDFNLTDAALQMFREHVYFRSSHGIRIPAPSRVFWYRTKDHPSRVFAMSTIEKVVVSGFDHVWGRFGGYGVLSRSEVEDTGASGRSMAIRFARSRRLRREKTLDDIRNAAARLGVAELAVPYGPRALDPRLAQWILSDGGVE